MAAFLTVEDYLQLAAGFFNPSRAQIWAQSALLTKKGGQAKMPNNPIFSPK
jgi:hypothetical protein